jgi:hypothetical protein
MDVCDFLPCGEERVSVVISRCVDTVLILFMLYCDRVRKEEEEREGEGRGDEFRGYSSNYFHPI